MITFYFDENIRSLVQAPGNQSPAGAQTWVYFDNYNLQVYIVAGGIYQPILSTDTLTAILYQPQPNLPEQQLAIIGTPTIATDANGNQYFQLNVNLSTTQLAALVQTPNHAAQCLFHFLFNPTDTERFSQSQDISITVNPDPLKDAAGTTPAPPGYPSNPNVFERIANKATPSGYASLDATGKVPTAQIPTGALGGDMLKSVYDTDHNNVVDTCDSIVLSKVIGTGSAAALNAPAVGVNASPSQVVKGDDTRLTDTRTPITHGPTHLSTDAIPDVTLTSHGLCVPPDGTTVQISGGKLIATTTGSGDMLRSVYDTGSTGNTNAVDNARTVQTHQIPAAGDATGTQIVLANDSRLTNARTPSAHAATHTGGSDPIPLVTPSAMGLCPPVDNTSITVGSGKLSAILATTSAPGIVRPDGTTIGVSAGNISANIATTGAAGIVKPDGASIAVSGGGVISTVGGIPIGSHGFRVYFNSASANVIAASSLVKLTWDTVDFDTDAFHSGASFQNLTVPVGQAGYYILTGAIQWTPGNSTGTYRGVSLPKSMFSYLPLVSTYNGPTIGISGLARFNAGDLIYLQAVHDATASITLNSTGGNTWFAGFRIG